MPKLSENGAHRWPLGLPRRRSGESLPSSIRFLIALAMLALVTYLGRTFFAGGLIAPGL